MSPTGVQAEPRTSAGIIAAETVAAAFPDVVCLFDLGAMRLLWINKHVRDVLGFGTEELLALGADLIPTLVHPDDVTPMLSFVERTGTLADGEVAEQQIRVRRRDGAYRWFGVRTTVFERRADGTAAVTLGVGQDVTERREMQARLLIADRMASMGTLAAGVAHEINNPLAYVCTNLDAAEALLDDLDAQACDPAEARPRLRKLLQESRHGAARVRDIVRDLKTFSRPDPESGEPLDVRRALDSAVNMAWNEIRHRARLTRDYGEVPLVDAPRGRLAQLWLNLLVNAAHAIPEGDVERHEIRLVTRTGGDGRAMVEVHDTGAGIAPENLPRLFDPFFTTRALGGGTGLGLSICHGIVRSLGGEIEVQSTVGSGSAFRVTLPASALARPRPRPASVPAPPPARRGRVLLIDDEPRFAQSLAHLLSDEHDVVTVERARDGLDRLLAGEPYDAVLCDLMMPEMSGMELWGVLEGARPDLLGRLLFVTGGAFTQRASAFVRAHAPQVVEKPIEHEVLRGRLRRLVE